MEPWLIALSVVVALALIVVVLSFLSPPRITYSEVIEVAAPSSQVYDDIRLQERLMQWSAWPAATRSTCAVDVSRAKGGRDGEVGARTVFLSGGKPSGFQEIVSLTPGTEVVLTLTSPGPPHTPRLTFEVMPLGPASTRVTMHFRNEFPRPFNAVWHLGGLSRWVRKLHLDDLAGLKRFSEGRSGASGQAA
ncbi:MAG: hypothetical protein SFW67_06385 [Myxococcaceae bacterium]|nr:hypothetical protein [Myxococcaceae bacterium]